MLAKVLAYPAFSGCFRADSFLPLFFAFFLTGVFACFACCAFFVACFKTFLRLVGPFIPLPGESKCFFDVAMLVAVAVSCASDASVCGTFVALRFVVLALAVT